MIRSARRTMQQQPHRHLLHGAAAAGEARAQPPSWWMRSHVCNSSYRYSSSARLRIDECRSASRSRNGTIDRICRYKVHSTLSGLSCSHSSSSHSSRTYHDSSSSGVGMGTDPVLDTVHLQQAILDLAPSMAQGLATDGYWTTTTTTGSGSMTFFSREMIGRLRQQAVELRRQGRYEQSWSERVVDDGHGRFQKERFDKEGVFACEPDGQDYDTAPDLIVYMSVVLQTLPHALNQALQDVVVPPYSPTPDLSHSCFNAKLAVTLPGGSTYPLHVDNPQGLSVNDTRKLTCILYLNPDYDAERGDGGELRLLVRGRGSEHVGQEGRDDDEATPTQYVDLTPEGGRMVLFWSDEIPHEVLPTAPNYTADARISIMQGDDNTQEQELDFTNPLDRYALTLWIPTENVSTIHNEASKFRSLRDVAFPAVLAPRGR